jgi:phage head maturation protease
MIKFTSSTFTVDAAGPDGLPRRTITGIAVPYNVFATVNDGTQVQFAPGSLPVDGKAPKLYMYHNSSLAIGIVSERVDSPEAMYFTATVSNTRAGDEALVLAADGVLDSVSVGVNPTEFKFDSDGNMTVIQGEWVELSVVPIGAYSGATIQKVSASLPDTEPETEAEPETETEETPMEIEAEVIVPTAPIFASAKREPRLPNAAEFIVAMHNGGIEAANANKVWADYRAYHKSDLEFADTNTTNVAGIIPKEILGPVFADINYIAPLLTAVGTRAMPANGTGSSFIRPTWTTHPTVGEQTNQFDAVSSTTSVIASNTVSKTTFAGSASLSYQTISFSDPAAMAIILQDLAGQYLTAIDNFACDNLLAAATSAGVWDLTAVDLMKSIYDAAVVTSAATNFLPTHIAVDPATWGKMGQLVDDNNRPIFPAIGAPGLSGQNSMGAGSAASWSGSNPLGLQIIVDNKFAAKTMVIFNANAVEIYRQDQGLLSVENPSTISRLMSVFGYAAFFAPNANMIQKITQA